MGEHHHHDTESMSDTRLWAAIAVNMLLTLAQVVGGIIAGSLALVADALHNFSDSTALVIALLARRISRRMPDDLRTFGYKRAQMIGAFVNITTLIIVGLYLVFEAIMRFFERTPVDGWIVIWLAGLALLIDVVTAVLTYTMSRESINIRAAFIHNVSDALASVAVMIAGVLILIYKWYWADLAATLIISSYILYQSFGMMKVTIHILMQGVPEGVDPIKVKQSIEAIEGIHEIHHTHIWQLDEHNFLMEAHVVIDDSDLPRMEAMKQAIKKHIADEYHIHHSTFEFETEQQRGGQPCAEHAH